MDLRSDVQSVLNRFEHRDPAQVQKAVEYRDFVHAHDDAVWRSCAMGHVTASAIVVDATSGSVLLTLHPKVGRWLQLGGHLESSDVSLRSAALREVDEESGIRMGAITAAPVRLDRHPVPCGRNADGSVRGSVHWDVQYVVRLMGTPEPTISNESDDLRWFARDALPDIDASVTALIDDAQVALRGPTTWVTFG
jgi:8-oxo-dGTP pyrophosphatase MutT (NUDIX family)